MSGALQKKYEKGKEEGKEENRIETAENLLSLGVDIDIIHKSTKLPKKQIEELIKKLNK